MTRTTRRAVLAELTSRGYTCTEVIDDARQNRLLLTREYPEVPCLLEVEVPGRSHEGGRVSRWEQTGPGRYGRHYVRPTSYYDVASLVIAIEDQLEDSTPAPQ